jgi:hypothetical protein
LVEGVTLWERSPIVRWKQRKPSMILASSSMLPLFALALAVVGFSVFKLLSAAVTLGEAFESEENAQDVSFPARAKRALAGLGALILVGAIGGVLFPEDTGPTEEELRAERRAARRFVAAEKAREARLKRDLAQLQQGAPITMTDSRTGETIVISDPRAEAAEAAAAEEARRYEAQEWKPDAEEEAEIRAAEASLEREQERQKALHDRLFR